MSPEDRKSIGVRTLQEGVSIEDAKAEIKLQNEICNYLNLHGIEVCRPAPHKKSTIKRGWPDLTFAFRGVPCVMEAKTPIGKLTPEQEAMIPKLIANGWHHWVVRSVKDVQEALWEIDAQVNGTLN